MAVRTRPIEFIRDLPAANRPGKIISALTEAYPHSLSAKTLMEEMGLNFQLEPVPSFVSLSKASIGVFGLTAGRPFVPV
ncbi:hypothetical protein G6M02_07990 [Agrobacterium rhizogenes]|nr:hypothetical protein [Rhizobium rhizogenes]